MSQQETASTEPREITNYGTTVVEVMKRSDGTWEATQHGLEVVGTGDSAARATEDMAGRIAELEERGEI